MADSTHVTLNYLSEAAHLLYRDAPEISAHLSHRHTQLAEQHGKPATNVERQQSCVACGQIFVLGVDSILRLKPAERPKRTKSPASGVEKVPASATKEITCGRCHQVTRVMLARTPKAYRMSLKKMEKAGLLEETSEKPSSKQADEPNASVNANAASKKRAKNRKGGLQALLASQQKPAKSLSLSDFMK